MMAEILVNKKELKDIRERDLERRPIFNMPDVWLQSILDNIMVIPES